MDQEAYLAEPIHPSMITDSDRALLLEVASIWSTAGGVNDNGRLTTLYDVYWHRVRAAERENLGFTTPRTGVANGRAVARILLRSNHSRLTRTKPVFALDAREERHKVIRVR